LAGAPPVEEPRRPTVSALVIGPGYFRTLGAAVLSGREFRDADGVSGEPVVIVNQRFASRSWPGEDALGKRLRLFDGAPDAWLTVAGVVANIVQNDATRQAFDPVVYVPYRQEPTAGMWAIVRTDVPAGSLATALRRELHALDTDLPIWRGPSTLSDRLAEVYWDRELYGMLFLILATMALLLASVGLYAVVAQSVNQRTQEIGVRMAMGATARDILALVLEQGMQPLGIGLIVGLATSLAVTRVLKSMLVDVSPTDPIAYTVASAVLIVSATLGCVIPARRALGVDPVVALRHE
jgi:predicted permease